MHNNYVHTIKVTFPLKSLQRMFFGLMKKNKSKKTPVHLAIENGRLKLVYAFIIYMYLLFSPSFLSINYPLIKHTEIAQRIWSRDAAQKRCRTKERREGMD